VLPKPLQKPHPPMWMACTNRDTIRVAAKLGVGALAFSFLDPEEAQSWSQIYYDIIKSEECVPIGHAVNANIAMVSAFSLHNDRETAIRQGQEGFEFFGFAMRQLVAEDVKPGRTTIWEDFQAQRKVREDEMVAAAAGQNDAARLLHAPGIGTPDDFRDHIRNFEAAGVDQIIFLQQAGRNTHEQICDSLNLFADEVLPEFKARQAAKEAAKAKELAPYIEAALARKQRMPELSDDEIPVVRASVKSVQVNRGKVA